MEKIFSFLNILILLIFLLSVLGYGLLHLCLSINILKNEPYYSIRTILFYSAWILFFVLVVISFISYKISK